MDPDTYGIDHAVSELLAIFSCQWRNGMLPQIRFVPGSHGYRPDAADWGVPPYVSGPTQLPTSGITQPPIVGMCAYEVFTRLGEQARVTRRADFLRICSCLERYHDWLFRERDPWNEQLVLCLHPWETGTDNSPAFDSLIKSTRDYIREHKLPVEHFGRADNVFVSSDHRPTERDYLAYFGLLSLFKQHRYDQREIIEASPFLLQDVLFNSLFAASLLALARLQEEMAELDGPGEKGRLREEAARNREKAHMVGSAVRRKLWHSGDRFFYSYDCRTGGLLQVWTVSGFMPLMAAIATSPQASHLLGHLIDPGEFASEVPVPSTALNSPSFNPKRYWSGPSWPVTNWLIIRGLDERGLPETEELRLRTLNMIAEGADLARTRQAAMRVLRQNSVGGAFTTPSTRQYAHAWLWDSAIVALSWPAVPAGPAIYSPEPGDPGFWEYYDTHTGAPLGAAQMTWTASLFLELQDMGTL